MTKDIFSDLILPSDDELRRETQIEKMRRTKTGQKLKPHTEKIKQKISRGGRGIKKPKRTDEVKKQVSQKLKGRIRTIKEREAISKALTGHTVSKKSRKKISQSLTGVMKGIPKRKTTCPHCGKEGGIAPMMRFHFDNCKFKT